VTPSPPSTLLTDRRVVFVLATFCCILWGSSYPSIKGGYALFHIAAGDVPSKLVFAGWRFTLAGLLLLAYAALSGKAVAGMSGRTLGKFALLGLFQTTLQYTVFYIGLAYASGTKSSIMNATGTFFSVLMSHFIYSNDRLSYAKATGCVIGFLGVMVVNLGAGTGGLPTWDFTLLGEGFVVLAAFVLAAASIYGKHVSQQADPFVMTGYQLTFGGAALLLAGYLLGGEMGNFTLASSSLLAYLVLLSSLSISIWSLLLKYNRVSTITAFNFMVPVFGVVLSAVFLDESIFQLSNGIALVLVSLGIWLVTRIPPPVTPETPHGAGSRMA
jgi:drug/metabolite transporter (DMT)-like permease